jgi:hypothetical protein
MMQYAKNIRFPRIVWTNEGGDMVITGERRVFERKDVSKLYPVQPHELNPDDGNRTFLPIF